MARIRTIKPELPSDPSLAKCSRDARLTFTYLITQSDDYGFVPAAPRQIVGLLFPHDDDITPAHVGAWVNELVAVGLAEWAWTTDGLPLVRLLGWESHQRIDNRRKAVLSSSLRENDQSPPPYAATRRDSPRTAASPPLEPPTSDLRPVPPTSDQKTTTSPSSEKLDERGEARQSWVADACAIWAEYVSVMAYGEMGKRLKPLVAQYGPDLVLVALRAFCQWRSHRLGEEKVPGLPTFIRDFSAHVPGNRQHELRKPALAVAS